MSKRELLIEMGLEEAIVFESPDYDDAIVGYDVCSERVVYDYDLMVESLMGGADDMDFDDAIDFIEYNTVRVCPYIGERAPIILRRLD
jgi:hypothetical protein